MIFASEIRKPKLKIPEGMCKDCEHWDTVEQKPNFRACLLKIFDGKITMICRKDDSCKSFKRKGLKKIE